MPRKALFLIASIIFAAPLAPEGLVSFLPESDIPKATRLLASIDQISEAIDAKRAAARGEQLRAEADTVEQYALIAASREGRGLWAKPDGSAVASSAPAAYASARARAKEAAHILASGEDAKGEAPVPDQIPALVASREAAADSLASLILASRMGQKSASGLERLLAGRSRSLAKQFPEAWDVASMLSRAGAAGARAAAAAMAHRGAADIARSLVASKARIVALAPASAVSLARLETVLTAYGSWIAAAAAAAYPGDLDAGPGPDKEALATGIRTVAGLPPGRASALLAALDQGDGRDAASAEAARRLAGLWESSPAARRSALSSLCGVQESDLALFATAVSLTNVALPTPSPALIKAPGASDLLSILTSLNGLEATIAEEESRASSDSGDGATGASAGLVPREAEPILVLLERPELAAVARSETRYANLYAEAAHRLGAIYEQAAEGASARLEASGSIAKAAALALGSSPAGISVRSIDLKMPPGEAGRKIAFFAIAQDASGHSVSIPLAADKAGTEYAAAFAKAAGLRPAAAGPAAALARYRQFIVTAYDPEGSYASLAVDIYPKATGPEQEGKLLGAMDLELALLGERRP
jgi:hypothetical protein